MNFGEFFVLFAMILLVFTGVYFGLSLYEKETAYKDFFYGFQEDNISVIQFYKNMRYPNSEITFKIEPSCSAERRESALDGFNMIDEKTIITFKEVSDNPEIDVLCSNLAPKSEEKDHFIAGEGGPSQIINASAYSVIYTGKVALYRNEKCPTPHVAPHEILHALGFDHNNNPESIMYPVSSCDQILDKYVIEKIDELYSIKSAPDLVIEKATADKDGRFLNYKITVANFGLKPSLSSELVIYGDDEEVKRYDLKDTSVGVRKVITVENLRLPLGTQRIIFEVVTSEDEISKSNNGIELLSDE